MNGQGYIPKKQLGLDINYNALAESSLRDTQNGNSETHIIDVKTRAQGIVLNVPFDKVESVKVKLVNTDLPDVVYYDLKGSILQTILDDKYGDNASNVNQFAIIPFALSGYLDNDDDTYIEVTVKLAGATAIKWDKIVPALPASNPITVKYMDNVPSFDSAKYDELFILGEDLITDIRYQYAGRGVALPQFWLRNQYAIKGYASQKLMPDTEYNFSASTDFYLVEY